MDITRRILSASLALAAASAAVGTKAKAAIGRTLAPGRFGTTLEEAVAVGTRARAEMAKWPGMQMTGAEQVAMLVYPGMTALDLVGPQYFLASMTGAKVHLVGKDPSLAPLMTDTGFAISPTIAMRDCPRDLDVFFVPGGIGGTIDAMKDAETIDFVADRGSRAKHLTSVCTGSLVLGQAGLLKGRRATSHWTMRHLLPLFGAIEVDERVVVDGNILTGAGVSSGLDFALALVAQLRGEPFAKVVQLSAEYAPEPMFQAGTLAGIDPKLGELSHDLYARGIFRMTEASKLRRQ